MDALLIGLTLPNVENHSLAVLARAAGDAGFEAATVSFSGWRDIGEVARAVLEKRPRLVGISLQNTEAALASLSLARILRQLGFTGKLVCGGHFSTLNAEEILRSPAGVDVVVRFAGEAALVGLLRGEPPRELPGVVFRDGERVIHGAPPAIADGIPRWARPPALPQHLGFPAADLVVSRGCEARCSYCCVAGMSRLAEEHGSGYSRASVDAVAEEIAWLWHERGARVFNFMDDNLLPMESGAAVRFLDDLGAALRARRVGRIAFSLQLRADVVDEPVADALVDLGLVRAYVGIDGHSPSQLRMLGRHAPAEAGPLAIDLLAERGVFCLANALLFGPTIAFEAVLAEIEALEFIRKAPVHLLPIDARAGTTYFDKAERRGLIEGGFLWRHYRFEDSRTARVAELILSMPTRLVERSVPIALYDLGYNLGIARRLLPEVAIPEREYRRIAEAWNRDQLRLLRAAALAAQAGETGSLERFKAEEAERVRAHDEALVAECDQLLIDLERAASRAQRRSVSAHARGRILSSVALAMGVASCRTQPFTLPPPDLAEAPADLATSHCPPGRMEEPGVPVCICPFDYHILISFDGRGVVTQLTAADGSSLPPEVLSCLQDFFKSYCYPSLAGSTKEVLSSHCWVA